MSDPLPNLTPARIKERSEAAEQIAQCLTALREPAWIDVIADSPRCASRRGSM